MRCDVFVSGCSKLVQSHFAYGTVVVQVVICVAPSVHYCTELSKCYFIQMFFLFYFMHVFVHVCMMYVCLFRSNHKWLLFVVFIVSACNDWFDVVAVNLHT